MAIANISDNMKITSVLAMTSASNTTELKSATVALAGYESIMFLTDIKITSSANILIPYLSTDSATGNMKPLQGVHVPALSTTCWVEIRNPRPEFSWAQVQIVRDGAGCKLGTVYALQGFPRSLPANNSTAPRIQGSVFTCPSTGTATASST